VNESEPSIQEVQQNPSKSALESVDHLENDKDIATPTDNDKENGKFRKIVFSLIVYLFPIYFQIHQEQYGAYENS
jgi:hypothetical protein